MLQSMRDKLKGVVAYFIVGLLILVFGMFGVDAFMKGNARPNAVATVNGKDITERDLALAVGARKQQLTKMLGENVDPQFLSDEFLRNPVLEDLIQRRLLESAMEDSKLNVADEVIDKQIVTTTMFQKEGKFDSAYYSQLLSHYGYTPASYREELKKDHLLAQFQSTFTQTGFVTDREVLDLARLQFQTRSFDVVTLPIASALSSSAASEAEVTAYYNQHKNEFMTEALVAAEYIELKKSDVLSQVQVSDADIRSQYDAEVKAAGDNVERHAAHILIEEKADGSHQVTLDTIKKRLAKGEDFAALAKEYSVDTGSAQSGGDVGVTTGSSFVPEFEQALKKLSVGQISEPVKSQFGYHIIKLLGQKVGKQATLEASRARIENELKSQQADDLYAEKMEILRDARKNSVALADLATQISADHPPVIQHQDFISRQAAMMLFRKKPVVDAMFAEDIATGGLTDVLELDKGRAMVLRITDRKPPEVKSLDQVRVQVVETVRHEKAQAVLKSQALAIQARVKSGDDLEKIAHTDHLVFQPFSEKIRTDNKVDAEILKKVFTLSVEAAKPESTDTLLLTSGDYAVITLKSVHVPDAGQITEEQKSQIAKDLANTVIGGEFHAMQDMLASRADTVRRKAAASQ